MIISINAKKAFDKAVSAMGEVGAWEPALREAVAGAGGGDKDDNQGQL